MPDYTQDANCQGAWLFTEGSGTTVADSSQNTNTGNLLGDGAPAWASASPPAAYAPTYVTFDGVDDIVNCGSDASIDIDGTAVSVVFWMNNSYSGTSTVRRMFAQGTHYMRNYSTSIYMIFSTSGNDCKRYTNTGIYATGSWYHIAMTYDGSFTGAGIKIYANGIEATYSTTQNGSGTLTDNTASNFLIGGTDPEYLGSQTEFGDFSDVLTSTEINDIMDNGLVGGGAPPAAVILGKMTARTNFWGDV